MSADEEQRNHNLAAALTARFAAITDGSANWHDKHQAGVLLVRLAEMANWLYGDVWRKEIAGLINTAKWFFDAAYEEAPNDGVIQQMAIMCDRAIAIALERRMGRHGANPATLLESVIETLNKLPDTPKRNHQLSIAYGFLARVRWWAWLGREGEVDYFIWETERMAQRFFRDHLAHAPDGGRAFCSHLLAMALIHDQRGDRPVRRQYARAAARLARSQQDGAQQGRALIIYLRGAAGEKFLLRRRRTAQVFWAVWRWLGQQEYGH